MSVTSAAWVIIWLLVSGLFWCFPRGLCRRIVFGLLTLGFAIAFVPNIPSAIALMSSLLLGYAVAMFLRKWPSKLLFPLSIAFMVAGFVVVKRYDGLQYILSPSWLNLPITILGLSYILFRQIHFLTDAMQGQIDSCSLSSYLVYQLNPLTIVAGPIQRYQEFHRFWVDQRPLVGGHHNLLATYQRIFIGLLKVSAVAPLFLSLWSNAIRANDDLFHHQSPIISLATLWYAYPVYIYFNFSGYCDIVIAFGSLIGLSIPENFDQPYLSRNMIDFWTRQHRSLSFWIRDYLFTPMYQWFAEHWQRHAASCVYFCYFVAFFIAGIWHGSTEFFIIFGLLHGLGVSVTKLWEQFLIRRYGRLGWKHYLESQPIRLAAIALTLNFVCFAFIFFTPDPPQVLRGLGASLKELFAIV